MKANNISARKVGFARISLALLAALIYTGCEQKSSNITFYSGTVWEAFKEAKKTGKKVFVLAIASDCGNCDPFVQNLNQQPETKRILTENYISVYVSTESAEGKRFLQLLRCPAYPFPYFFDQNGKLETFGFPATTKFDISVLSTIYYDETQFQERFGFDISTERYKEIIELTLQAYLLQGKNASESDLQEAKKITLQSLKISRYPFNVCLAHRIAMRLGEEAETERYRTMYPRVFTTRDEYLFAGLYASPEPYL